MRVRCDDEDDTYRIDLTKTDANEAQIDGDIRVMLELADTLRKRGWGPDVRARDIGRMRSEVQTTLELIAIHAEQARRLIKLADSADSRHELQ